MVPPTRRILASNALFAVALAHDEIDRAATLPGTIHLDGTPKRFNCCFHIVDRYGKRT